MRSILIRLTKSKTHKKFISLLLVICALLLGFMSSFRAVYAYDPVQIIQPPTVVVVPDYDFFEGAGVTFKAYVTGSYSQITWQARRTENSNFIDTSVHSLSYNVVSSQMSYTGLRQLRVVISYKDENNVTKYVFSNIVSCYLPTYNNIPELTRFRELASTLLGEFFTIITTILNYCVSHPIIFIGLIMSLSITAIGFLRNFIGGRYEKEEENLGS